MTIGGGTKAFCRILHPGDPWVQECSEEERAENFRGGGDTSVADTGVCVPLRVLAAFYGSRRRPEPPKPRYIGFTEAEAHVNGGRFESTDAVPPWPEDYNRAHHEIVVGADKVSRHVAREFGCGRKNLDEVDRTALLDEICALYSRDDAHRRLRENAGWRLRKLFAQERELWDQLAARYPKLREDPTIAKKLRSERR